MKIIVIVMIFAMSSAVIAAEKVKKSNKPKKMETKLETVEEVDPSEPYEEPKYTNPPIIKKADYIFEDSSRHNRMDKKYAAWVQLLGVGPSLSSSAGLAFGYYYTSEDIFFIEVTRGSDSASFLDSNYSIETSSIGLHWKHFLGNSFYLNTGIDHRSLEYDYKSTLISTTQSHFEATSTIVSFGIGNQWQWDSFTLGCDWVGVSVPFAHDISKASITTGSTYAEGDFKEDQDDLAKDPHIQLLRFYLGASF